MDFEKLIAAVPDIGDKQAREMAIARIAHASGAADERAKWRDRISKEREQIADLFLTDPAGDRLNVLSALTTSKGQSRFVVGDHESGERYEVIFSITEIPPALRSVK